MSHMPSVAPTTPVVSLGLPVYNGENHVREAIAGILAQTYTDFELIISDNASTDGTEAICREFAALDPRIRYERLPANIGAAPNFNRIVPLARGRYFKWAAHDDICLPGFLEACVAALDADPGVILACTQAEVINEASARVPTPARMDADLDGAAGPAAADRFRSLIPYEHWCVEVFGLVRTAELVQTPLIGAYVNSDRVLLAELALRGRFHRVPQVLFQSRDHAKRSVRASRIQERASWFDPKLQGRILFPVWRTLREFLGSIRRVPMPLGSRLACLRATGGWVVRYRRMLFKDLRHAAKQVIARVVGRRA